MTKVTAQNWRDVFEAHMARAMDAAGIETKPEYTEAATDRTWGDKVAGVFYGADDDTNKRAARYFAAWVTKYILPTTWPYGAQYSIGDDEPVRMWRYTFSNGVTNWSDMEPAEVAEKCCGTTITEVVEAWAMPFVYYPCND